MNGNTRDFYDAHPRFIEKTRHSHKRLSENIVKLHEMTNSTQELHATDCSAQRKTTQISAKYANQYTQNVGLATAGGKNERKNTRRV